MSNFINTIDVLGDDAVMNSLIDETITELYDDKITKIGATALNGLPNLTIINFPNVIRTDDSAVGDCTALSCAVIPNVTSLGNWTFTNTALTMFDGPKVVNMSMGIFNNCKQFTTLILRSETICSLGNTNAFNNTLIATGTGYIYVPRALIEDYKVATNWSTYAAQFRALEDYTVDGTTTGELDETKI